MIVVWSTVKSKRYSYSTHILPNKSTFFSHILRVHMYGTRGNSCNKNARFFLSPLSPSAVSLRPCGVRLKLGGVLL